MIAGGYILFQAMFMTLQRPFQKLFDTASVQREILDLP